MITEMTGLPAGVVGFEIDGKVDAADYRGVVNRVLTPAFEAGEVRCVIVITAFDGMSGGALVEDLKMGVEHVRGWKRIALVSDIDWVTHLTHLFGWMTPGEVKTFSLSERSAALDWVAA